MTDKPFFLRWARTGTYHAHSETPSVEQCEAEGWYVLGNDPRYGDSVLMRKDDDRE
jgi:hypothetical protein